MVKFARPEESDAELESMVAEPSSSSSSSACPTV